MNSLKQVAVIYVLLGIGCATAEYTKTVRVTKDGNGKVVSTVIEETVSEPAMARRLYLEYIRPLRVEEDESDPAPTPIIVPTNTKK